MKHFTVFSILFLLLAGCTAKEYKGDIRYITNVPRRIVEREIRLLKERINTWARQVSHSDLVNDTAKKPYHNDQGIALRMRISSGRSVLRMLADKLRYSGSKIDFTRKEWGRASRVYCTLDPDIGAPGRKRLR